jgi:hypothetical protein
MTDKQPEARQPPSSLIHRLFHQSSTPESLPPMMRPLFSLSLSGQPSPSVASSPPDGRLIRKTSSSFRSLSPSPPALPHSSPPPISIISSTRDERKVSILFGLHRISPETHLVMFDRMTSAVPRRIPPPRTAGDSPLLLSLIDIDRKELQRRGKGEYSVRFCIVEPNTHI